MTDNLASSLADALGLSTVPPPDIPAGPVAPARFPSSASLRLPEASEEGIGELAARRRERELRDVSNPSALIRRAQKEWPHAATRVVQFAASEGITLGEAWLRVILAGVASLEAAQ